MSLTAPGWFDPTARAPTRHPNSTSTLEPGRPGGCQLPPFHSVRILWLRIVPRGNRRAGRQDEEDPGVARPPGGARGVT